MPPLRTRRVYLSENAQTFARAEGMGYVVDSARVIQEAWRNLPRRMKRELREQWERNALNIATRKAHL